MFLDITQEVQANIKKNFSGIVVVYSPHTTAGIALLENEILHHVDIRFFLDTLVPKSKPLEGPYRNSKYLHDMISLRIDAPPDERINGHSHIRSLFFSNSEIIPVLNGELQIGEWKKIFFVELDPIRKRQIYVSLVGE